MLARRSDAHARIRKGHGRARQVTCYCGNPAGVHRVTVDEARRHAERGRALVYLDSLPPVESDQAVDAMELDEELEDASVYGNSSVL